MIDGSPINVQDYGAVGDGTTDDTAAFTAAITACPNGGTIVLAANKTYLISSLYTNKNVRFQGQGFWYSTNAVFGNAAWLNSANYGGTVMKFTATSGIALKIGVDGGFASGVGIENIMILGPGTGTSIGLQIGNASNEGAVGAIVTNVIVANFKTGYVAQDIFESAHTRLIVRGCDTGIVCENDSNNNEFYTCEVQFSTVDAILLDESRGNSFFGGLIQNCINKGIRTLNSAYGNKFYNIWMENSGAITDAIDFASGTQCVVFGGLVAKGNVKIGATNCTIQNVYLTNSASIETTAGGIYARFINSKPNGTTTLNGAYPIIIQDEYVTTPILNADYMTLGLTNLGTARLNQRTSSSCVNGVATVVAEGGLLGAGTFNSAYLTLVAGAKSTDSNTQFSDLVLWYGGGNAPTVISSQTRGSPAARTYTVGTSNFQTLLVNMSADTYNVSSMNLFVQGT
jgi:hypothetical protein